MLEQISVKLRNSNEYWSTTMRLDISSNNQITDVGLKLFAQKLNMIDVISGLVMQSLTYDSKKIMQEWICRADIKNQGQ